MTENDLEPRIAIEQARAAGFDDVNADLIYGSPWESETDWVRTLEGVLAVEPQHLSAYALTVEEGTPLATLVTTGRVPDVDPDIQAARHGVASTMLATAGYERYEISNWAQPGYACRHNVLYWCAGDYIGFGAGAHAHIGGSRHWSVRLPRDFIDAVRLYNTELKTIPGRWWAALLYPEAKQMAQFEVEETTTGVPKVDFGTSTGQ